MRRSSAPSQLGNKKARFSAPLKSFDIKRAENNEANVQAPAILRILDEATGIMPVVDEHMDSKTLGNSQLLNASEPEANEKQFSKPVVLSGEEENQPDSNPETRCRYFSVMWCKMTTRKHKIWEGDAFLIVERHNATLKDTDGKVLSRKTGLKIQQLKELEDGYILSVGGKECQIQNEISKEEFLSNCKVTGQESKIQIEMPAPKRPKILSVRDKKSISNKMDTLNALVMPKPSNSHQWKYNVNNLPVTDVIVDNFLSRHLHQHQREGATFLYQCIMGMKDFQGHGAILADEMGLGKTLQCIALIWTVLKQGPYGGQPAVKRVLIVTPGSLVKNWDQEFGKWLGFGRIAVFAVNARNKVQDYLRTSYAPVLIMSYEMFLRHEESLKKFKFDLLICDEGHRLKNASIRTTNALSNLGACRRILLTGTPIQNDLEELHSLVDFCNPGLLGSISEFRTSFTKPIVQGLQQASDEFDDDEENMTVEEAQVQRDRLAQLTSQCMLRRTHQVIQHLLPPKVEHVVICEASALQRYLYNKVIESEVSHLQESYSGVGAGQYLRCIVWLKKLCNHPSLLLSSVMKQQEEMSQKTLQSLSEYLPGGSSMGEGCPSSFNPRDLAQSGKLLVLSNLLTALNNAQPREKVVLVSSHKQTLDVLEGLCKCFSYPYLRLDGSTPLDKRQAMLKQFNTSGSKYFVFLLSSRAGGVGLSLVGGSRVVLFDLDWNPAADLQAVARVWRQGQKRAVHTYRLITAGSIEETIFQRQVCKQTLSNTVLDSADVSAESFNSQELKDLLYPMRMESNTHSLLDCKCLDELELDAATTDTRKTKPEVQNEEGDEIQYRSCQLGEDSCSTGLQKDGDMGNLMLWNHIPKDRIKDESQDDCLAKSSANVTFVFQRKVVTDYTKLPEL